MLGLGDYESSSEDEVERKGPSPKFQVFEPRKSSTEKALIPKQQRTKDIPPTTSQAGQNEGTMSLNSPGPLSSKSSR